MTRGFTLIELIIYISLQGLIMTSLIGVFYQISISHSRNEDKIAALEEGDFLLNKVGWFLNGVSVINSPSIGSAGQVLEFSSDVSDQNPIRISESDTGELVVEEGEGSAVPLSGTAEPIKNLEFIRSASSTSDFIKVSFQIKQVPFYFTKYLP